MVLHAGQADERETGMASGGSAVFVEVLWCEADFVVPVDGEWVDGEPFEIVQVFQFPADAFGQFARKVKQLFHTVVEPDAERVTLYILGFCYSKQFVGFHKAIFILMV